VMFKNIADILVDPEGALERRNHWEKDKSCIARWGRFCMCSMPRPTKP